MCYVGSAWLAVLLTKDPTIHLPYIRFVRYSFPYRHLVSEEGNKVSWCKTDYVVL